MALINALQSAQSALRYQSERLAVSADNTVNANTDGYKAGRVSASTVQNGATSSVTAVIDRRIGLQGLLAASTDNRDIAFAGNGFLAVQTTGGETAYSRGGRFDADGQGFLTGTNGARLLGVALDSQGQATGNSVGPVRVPTGGLAAKATETLTLAANLPAEVPAGFPFPIAAEIRDSLGNARTLAAQLTAQADGSYRLTVSESGSPLKQGDAAGAAYDLSLTFDAEGGLSGIDRDLDGTADGATAPDLFLTGGTTGAADQAIKLNISGLTRRGDEAVLGRVEQDGRAAAPYTGFTIANDGTVSARFANGETQPLYRLAAIGFANPDGLEALGDGLYGQTQSSGQAVPGTAGDGGLGDIVASARELSSTDLGFEAVEQIIAGVAYRAAAASLRTSDEMLRETINIKT